MSSLTIKKVGTNPTKAESAGEPSLSAYVTPHHSPILQITVLGGSIKIYPFLSYNSLFYHTRPKSQPQPLRGRTPFNP